MSPELPEEVRNGCVPIVGAANDIEVEGDHVDLLMIALDRRLNRPTQPLGKALAMSNRRPVTHATRYPPQPRELRPSVATRMLHAPSDTSLSGSAHPTAPGWVLVFRLELVVVATVAVPSGTL